MNNGWRELTAAPRDAPLELWVERPGFEGRLFQRCRFSVKYGWLDETGRTFPTDHEIIAWRPNTKGPFDGDEK